MIRLSAGVQIERRDLRAPVITPEPSVSHQRIGVDKQHAETVESDCMPQLGNHLKSQLLQLTGRACNPPQSIDAARASPRRGHPQNATSSTPAATIPSSRGLTPWPRMGRIRRISRDKLIGR